MAQWFRVLIALQRTWVPFSGPTWYRYIGSLPSVTPGLGRPMPSLGVCWLQAHIGCTDSMQTKQKMKSEKKERAEVLLSGRIFV